MSLKQVRGKVLSSHCWPIMKFVVHTSSSINLNDYSCLLRFQICSSCKPFSSALPEHLTKINLNILIVCLSHLIASQIQIKPEGIKIANKVLLFSSLRNYTLIHFIFHASHNEVILSSQSYHGLSCPHDFAHELSCVSAVPPALPPYPLTLHNKNLTHMSLS